MRIKLTAQQKAKPIYTAQDVWDIIHPIHMRENKMRRQKEYFWPPKSARLYRDWRNGVVIQNQQRRIGIILKMNPVADRQV